MCHGIQLLGHKLKERAKLVKQTTLIDLLGKCREIVKRDVKGNLIRNPKLAHEHGDLWPRNELEKRSELYADNNLKAVIEKSFAGTMKGAVSHVKHLVTVPDSVFFWFSQLT